MNVPTTDVPNEKRHQDSKMVAAVYKWNANSEDEAIISVGDY